MLTKNRNFLAEYFRAIACLLIVNYHTGMLNIPISENLAKGGFILNVLFIGLSAFFIGLGIREKSHLDFAWVSRRLLRIYPSLFIFTLLFGLLFFYFDTTFNFSDYLFTLSGFSYFFTDMPFGIHLWFVTVILMCYLLLPFVFYVFKNKPLLYLLTLFLLLFLNGIIEDFYSKISAEVSFRLIYHCLVFFAFFYLGYTNKRIGFFYFFFVMLFVFLLCVSMKINLWVFYPIIAIFIIIALVWNKPRLLPENRFITFLSNISFEIYLVHYPIIIIFSKYNLNSFYVYPLVFLFTLLSACFVYQLKNYILKRLL